MKNRLILPVGVKDYFGKELKIKKILEQRITHCFGIYGYEMVKTPTLEYMDIYKEKENNEDIFKFINSDEILALRYDLTPSICRFVSSQFKDRTMPFRVSYIENTFRDMKKYEAIKREFTQAGAELIGTSSIEADSEIIALAINSVLSIGADINFKLDISDVNFLQGILENSNFTEYEKIEIEKALIRGDFVRSNEIVLASDCPSKIKNLFYELPFLKGKFVLNKALEYCENKKSIDAIKGLMDLEKILGYYNLLEYINFDLSILGSFSYYSGLIFHGYCSNVGFSIVDGGRYDLLLNNFAKNMPAVGFAINTDGLLLAIKDCVPEFDTQNKTLLIPHEDNLKEAYGLMEHFRKNDMEIILSLDKICDEDIKIYAKENEIGGILKFISNNMVEVINLETDEKSTVNIVDLMGGEA